MCTIAHAFISFGQGPYRKHATLYTLYKYVLYARPTNGKAVGFHCAAATFVPMQKCSIHELA